MFIFSFKSLIQKIVTQKKFATDTLYIFTLRALQIILQLAATYFVVRAISVESYGEYQFILSVVGTLAIFSLPGIHNATMQATARGFPGTYLKAVPISFFASTIGSLALVGFSLWFFSKENTELALGFLIAAPLFPFYHGLRQWRGLYTGQENFKAHFIYNSASAFITSIAMIIAMFMFPGTLLAPLIFLLLIPVLQNIWITIFSMRKIPKDAPAEAGVIRYGIKTSFYSAISIIANHIEKLLLFAILSPVSLAVFVVANRLADLFQNLNQDLAVVLAPKFAKLEYYTQTLDRYIKIFVFIYAIGIILFAFTALPPLLILIFGEQYSSSIPYAQALLCSVAIGNMATIRFRFIRSKIDGESHRKVIIFTSVARIISAVVFVSWLGVLGAVISVYVYKIALILAVNVVIKKHRPPADIKRAETST